MQKSFIDILAEAHAVHKCIQRGETTVIPVAHRCGLKYSEAAAWLTIFNIPTPNYTDLDTIRYSVKPSDMENLNENR